MYEFRASNPKALNTLEGSGVFATYQLQINYRSNQEILDFANVTLANIEANQYARIQLQSDSLSPVTSKSFKNKVRLNYHHVATLSKFEEDMPNIFTNNVFDFVDEKIANGEKICFLSYTRFQVNKMMNILKAHYGNSLKIESIVPDKAVSATVFSSYIRRNWSRANFLPSNTIMETIGQDIMVDLPPSVQNSPSALNNISKFIGSWIDGEKPIVNGWLAAYNAGIITHAEFIENVKQNLLQFEIRKNAIRNSLLRAKNQEDKQNSTIANCDIVLSTIHSAKGLEFDNTVVIYQNDNQMAEDRKRMYYVALTRAMNSELVIAYGTSKNPAVKNNYKALVESLQSKSSAPSVSA